ncbi:hypothetical protein HYY69_04890 [Candidatus Woesearchaeota archaeon]|nr:hypothetical protein [Candidatus Woesearchaeota archaeon]
MENEALSKQRSEVIEKFINCEMWINVIITQNYFKDTNVKFILEVLYQDSFSYGLRRNILKKIVSNIDSTFLNNMDRLNAIRNHFAHLNNKFYYGHERPTQNSNGVIPNPKKLDSNIDFENEYLEFLKLEPKVTADLQKMFNQLIESEGKIIKISDN